MAVSDMVTGEKMRDNAPDQPGAVTAVSSAARACLVVIVMAISLPGVTALAQPDGDLWDTILVHPDVTTVLHLPDEVEGVRVTASVAGLIQATKLGDKVLIRPQRGAPAWDEVSLQVKTATVRVRFRLRLARRAHDAWRHVAVRLAERAAEDPAPGTSEAAPGEPAASAPAGVSSPEAPEPAASASASAPPPPEPSVPEPSVPAGAVTAEPGTAAAVDQRDAAAEGERDAPAAGSPRFEISVHAVAALVGAAELTVAGYEASAVRQALRAFGVRLTGAPPGRWWAVEANISGESLAEPTVHKDDWRGTRRDVVEVSGPLLRGDVGLRARVGAPWSLTAYVGGGLLVHLRDIEHTKEVTDEPPTPDDEPTRDMPFGGVLAVGMGLQYQAGPMLLGLDFQVRQGVPADYRSVTAVVSVGCFLNAGE